MADGVFVFPSGFSSLFKRDGHRLFLETGLCLELSFDCGFGFGKECGRLYDGSLQGEEDDPDHFVFVGLVLLLWRECNLRYLGLIFL